MAEFPASRWLSAPRGTATEPGLSYGKDQERVIAFALTLAVDRAERAGKQPIALRDAKGYKASMKFSEETAAEVCVRIASGEPLRKIAAELELGSHCAILERVENDPSFANQYTRAMERRAEQLADDIVAIADDDKLDPNDKRIRVDARKWVASKLKPKKYGDRIAHDVDANVKITVVDATQPK